MSITRDFKLPLFAGRSVPLVINANQYDDGEIWRFTLLDENGQKYSPSTGSIIGLKSDGHIIANAGTVSSTGLVIIPETEQMTAAVGKNIFELLIDDDTHGTANFIVLVEPRPGADGTPSDSDLAVFQEAIDAADTIGDVVDLVDDVAVLEARMDEFARLPDGSLSTAADAELVDIRVGADGTTYQTAGDAVRGQVGNVFSNIAENQNANESYIPIDTSSLTNDYILSVNDGVTANANEIGCYSDYIELNKTWKSLSFNRLLYRKNLQNYPQGRMCMFYDENKTFIDNGIVTVKGNIVEHEIKWETKPKYFRANFSQNIIKPFVSVKYNQSANIPINYQYDLNDLTDEGTYVLFANLSHLNAPNYYENGTAFLIVKKVVSSNIPKIMQVFKENRTAKFAIRTKGIVSTTAWGDWEIWNNDASYNILKNKKISILGDSISTYDGYNPTGYAYHYPTGNVTSVNYTWWKRLIDITQMTMVDNASWSGSYVSYQEGTSLDTGIVGYSDKRIADVGVDGTPDVIVVFIGTNDFIHNNGTPIGNMNIDSELPNGASNIQTFKEAYAVMINKLKTTYPTAHIYCCTLTPRYRGTDQTYPVKNGSGLSIANYNKAITDIALWMGCNLIRLDNIYNISQIGTMTIDGLHPNYTGMKYITRKVLQELIANEQTYNIPNL